MDDDFRDQVFRTLNQKETNELVEIWEKNDRVEWSDVAFEAIREILQNRLGDIPRQNEPILEYPEENIGEDQDEEINLDEIPVENWVTELAENNDIDGLVSILENNSDSLLRLEAAMALAQLGDKRGINYLQNALNAPNAEVNSQARKILAELNLSEKDLVLPQQQDQVEQETAGEVGVPERNLATQAYQSDKDQPQSSAEGESLTAKYPYLTGYVGFIALYTLTSVVIGFIPLPALFRLVLQIVAGFYMFRFAVKNNILPYV